MPEPERTIYGDTTTHVVMTPTKVYVDRIYYDAQEPECVLALSREQFDAIVDGYEREKEQERNGR